MVQGPRGPARSRGAVCPTTVRRNNFRAYYAAFHAGKALLLTEGLEIRSHQALGRLFSLHFVKTGKFSVRHSRILSKAQKYREEADYSSEFVFTLDDANERLQEVREFMTAVDTFLAKNR